MEKRKITLTTRWKKNMQYIVYSMLYMQLKKNNIANALKRLLEKNPQAHKGQNNYFQ